jgi:hypothetical protein
MSFGSITTRVRPIRVGFLVDPTNAADVYRAISLSTSLWGGTYNPIIPAYRRMPRNWEPHRYKHQPVPADIISGYLEGFDPDLVVRVGRCATRSFEIGNRDLVDEKDLLGDESKRSSSIHGISLIDVMLGFWEKELKFKRNDDLHIAIPEMPRSYRTFLASVFGALPDEVLKEVDRHFSEIPSVTRVKPTLATLVEEWKPNRMFPRQLSAWGLEYRPMRNPTLFVCDATSSLDVIDYWNLRAAGYYVLPAPVQLAETEALKKISREFVDEHYYPNRLNPKIMEHATVQRSRSLPEQTVKDFCESLGIEEPAEKNQFKYSLQWWYPRLWDTWARDNTPEGISFAYAYEEEKRIGEQEERLELRSLNPKFAIDDDFSSVPRFANEFRFRFYGAKEPMAEVIPEGSRELSTAIGRIGYREWRFSRTGPVFLSRRESDLIFLDIPRAEAVMKAWLKERGWKVTLSGPGRIASQLIKQLDGSLGISLLAHRGVIKLLEELEKEAGMTWPAVVGKLKKVISDDDLHFTGGRYLELLIKANALRLGARVQCPICTRHNWFELKSLEYTLVCKFCLSDFKPPLESPKDIEWAYRAHGPFGSSIAQGSFTVLLTLQFLAGMHHDRAVTPLFSYTATKDEAQLEADLTCLYKGNPWRDSTTYVVHAECKSFNRFEKRDVNRMRQLAAAFPGAILVFATLNDSLDAREVDIITPLAMSERRKRYRGGANSPVIVLTGVELFSLSGARNCWEGRDGIYKPFSGNYFDFSNLEMVADATGQLYLGLTSFHEWAEAERKKRPRGKKASKKVA